MSSMSLCEKSRGKGSNSSMSTAHSSASYDLSPGTSDICAKLVTTREGRKEAVVLTLTKPATIGRNSELCSYVVHDPLISGLHCKLYAVRSPSGGIIVSCHDVSRNGITLNGQYIKKASIILMDGDILGLPNSISFTCIHLWKKSDEKLTIFDPTPPSQPSYKRIGTYIVTSQCLGTGSFATVHLALDPSKHRQVACKSIRTRKEQEIAQVMKEVKILMTLKHPNINEIYDTEESDKFIHIFLQLCTGGDLFTYITGPTGMGNPLCEAEAKYLMYQILQGLLYLHGKSISHRAPVFQPENILLHAPGPYPRILIADFGLARPNAYQETLNVCGTVSYLPPEGILALDNKHLGYVGMPADCWSAGVMLYIMLAGFHPFDNSSIAETSSEWLARIKSSRKQSTTCPLSQGYIQNEIKVKERIVYGEVEFMDCTWDELPQAKSLVLHLLVHDYRNRATVQSALNCKWIRCEQEDLEDLYHQRIVSGVNIV